MLEPDDAIEAVTPDLANAWGDSAAVRAVCRPFATLVGRVD